MAPDATAARNMSIMMEETSYVRPTKEMEEKIAEIPHEDELLIGPCYDEEREELMFDPRNPNQSEDQLKEMMEACPNLGIERALNYLGENELPEAIRLAKKHSPQNLIPTWAVPGFPAVAAMMNRDELNQVLAVRKPTTNGAVEAVLPARLHAVSDTRFQMDMANNFLLGFDERRYLNAQGLPVPRNEEPEEVWESDDEEQMPRALTEKPKKKKKTTGGRSKKADGAAVKKIAKGIEKKKTKATDEKKNKKVSVKKVEKLAKKAKKSEPKPSTSETGKKPSTSTSTAKTQSKVPKSSDLPKAKKPASPINQKENEKPKPRRVLARCQEDNISESIKK